MRLACLFLAILLSPAAAQGRKEKDLEEFDERLAHLRIYNGQRHLEYGLELRKKGLTTQAAEQIVLAMELSEGENPGAKTVFRLMQRLDDGFWKRKLEHPSSAKLEAYEKKARKLREEDREEQLDLVKWAARRGLEDEALGELKRVIARLDEPLRFEEDELEIGGARVPKDLAARLRRELIEINGEPRVRDAFLERLPELERISEVGSDALLVRAVDPEQAARFHALGTALLPALENDLGARPELRLSIALFDRRADYERYLDATGMASHKVVEGFADSATRTAVVCTEGRPDAAVQGLVLHELVHLYQQAISRGVLPSWYSEGYAETFGGEGTFVWDGTRLETERPLASGRLESVKADPLPLAELLNADALDLWRADRAKALRFYAQSWAFHRFLAEEAGTELSERLERWRTMCLGAALGADFRNPYGADRAASQELFLELFGAELDPLESAFRDWLEGR